MRKNLFFVSVFCFLIACERTSLSPVEIKIDDGIGGFATVSSVSNTYTVKNGETLFDVANKFNIDPMNLAKLNGIEPPYNVRNGQVLRLPSEDESVRQDQTPAPYAPVQMEEKKEEVKKSDLDDKFEKMMNQKKKDEDKTSSAPAAVATDSSKSAKGVDFNKQADELSSPKVVSKATGDSVAERASEFRGEEKSDALSKKGNSPGKMPRPVQGKVISGFGENIDGVPNDGINIKAKAGTSVKTVADGEVLYAGNKLDESFGNVVVVKHSDGMVSSYANLQDISVKQGAKLKAGQKVGTVGKTGDVSEPQLHFEIMKDNTPLNPEKYLEK